MNHWTNFNDYNSKLNIQTNFTDTEVKLVVFAADKHLLLNRQFKYNTVCSVLIKTLPLPLK